MIIEETSKSFVFSDLHSGDVFKFTNDNVYYIKTDDVECNAVNLNTGASAIFGARTTVEFFKDAKLVV